MKKTLLAILSALLLFTTACSGGAPTFDDGTVVARTDTGLIPKGYPIDNVYHASVDCPYYLETTYADNQIAEAENGCYILREDVLLYMDFDAAEPIPVCARPNCLHNEETDPEKLQQCNAYFPGILLFGGVFSYNGQLYVLHSLGDEETNMQSERMEAYQLTQITPDGTTRKVARRIELEWGSGVIGYSCIHRGTFYCVQKTYGEKGTSRAEIWAYSLADPKKEPQIIYTSEWKETRSNIINTFYAYGNYLYWEEHVMNQSTGVAERRNYVLDLLTGEASEFLPPEGTRYIRNFIVNSSLFSYYTPLDSSEQTAESGIVVMDKYLYKSDLTGNDAVLLGNYPCGIVTADEQYIYMGEPIVGQPTAEQKLSIYDHELNLIDAIFYEGLYAPETTYAECDFFPLSGEKIIMQTYEKGIATYYWFDRSEIGSGSITPVAFLRCESGEYSVTSDR